MHVVGVMAGHRRLLGVGGFRRRRTWRACRRCCAVPAMSGRDLAQRVVDGAPVTGLDVVPRLVVGEGGLVPKPGRRASRIRGVGLGNSRKRKCQARGCDQPGGCVRHSQSKLDRRRWVGRCACAGHTRAVGPRGEASGGQMLRGGRSWPPEKNSACGAGWSGNSAATGGACGIAKPTVAGAVAVQHEAQRLHLSPASGVDADAWSCSACEWDAPWLSWPAWW